MMVSGIQEAKRNICRTKSIAASFVAGEPALSRSALSGGAGSGRTAWHGLTLALLAALKSDSCA